MNTWFVFALLSVFALAGSELSQKISLTQKKVEISAITNNFFVWTMQGIGGLILALILGVAHFEVDLTRLLFIFIVAGVYFVGGTLFYTSYKANSPSLSIILGSISIVVSTTLGILFLKESVVAAKLIGIALIFVSIFIANFQSSAKFSKYNMYAFLGGITFGIAFTLDKYNVGIMSPAFYVSLMSFSVAIVSFVLKGKHIISEARLLRLYNYYPMVMSALFATFFNFFTFMSYRNGGHVGAVDALNNSSVFLVILFEILILKDRSGLKKKVIASMIVVFAVWILSGVV